MSKERMIPDGKLNDLPECLHLSILTDNCNVVPATRFTWKLLSEENVPTQAKVEEEVSLTPLHVGINAECKQAGNPVGQARCSHFCASRRRFVLFRQKI